MLVINQIVDHILSVLLYMLIIFVLADMIIVYLVRIRKPLIKNKYFEFHKQYGFLKITIFKSICAVCFAYLLLEPSPNAGKLAAPIMVHGLLVMKLLIDFVRKAK